MSIVIINYILLFTYRNNTINLIPFLKSFIKRTIFIFGSLMENVFVLYILTCFMQLYWIFIKFFKSLDTSLIHVSIKYLKSVGIRCMKQIELSVLHRFRYFTDIHICEVSKSISIKHEYVKQIEVSMLHKSLTLACEMMV